jgi:hypothetical protein
MSDPKALPILSDKQLFLDDYIIERLDAVSRKLNRPVMDPGNPLLTGSITTTHRSARRLVWNAVALYPAVVLGLVLPKNSRRSNLMP